MFKFLSWKIKRWINLHKKEGNSQFFLSLYGMLKEKITKKISEVGRIRTEARYLIEFQNLWEKNREAPRHFRVLLLISSFFDLDGNEFMQGGAERYTVELNHIISKMGGELEVYQCGNRNWHRKYRGISFYGLNTNGFNAFNLNRCFHKWVPQGNLTIYYQMLLSAPLFNSPSICVSHGVDWDAHWLQSSAGKYQQTIRTIKRSIQNVTRLVSVDTNTINWIRSTDASLAKKCTYIPNFVELDQFFPSTHPHENFVVLYPRRLSEARGFWMVEKILPRLLDKIPNLEFHFCGKAEPFEQAEVNHLIKVYPTQVKFYDVPPEDMPRVYQGSDLVLIPTVYSEGTSLSCLEAMASRRPVIATNVGGLPDLIISGYNGILIDPTEDALFDAICCLFADQALREKLAQNGYEIAQVFSLSGWQEKWENIINEAVGLAQSE